jgi:two-component system sensor histidine kinase PhoQ
MFGHSLSNRLLIAVSVLLVLFFGITIVVLDSVFRDSSEQAIRERLDIQVLALMAASDEESGNKLIPDRQQLDSRYLSPNSGLYGQITGSNGLASWRSPSLLGVTLAFPTNIKPGARRFGLLTMSNGTRVLTLSVGLAWEFSNGRSQSLSFSVAESLEQYYARLQRFRVRLFGGFAIMSLLLLVSLAVLLRKVLQPLRRIEHEIEAIEAGQRAELGTGYPRELMGVTTNLNALLRSERERMGRYRNTLGNLAHSLKTPLAVIRNLLTSVDLRNTASAQQLDEQVGRMDDIVRYQLKRAAASAGMTLGTAPIPLHEVVEPLVSTLQKVYVERGVNCQVELAPDCTFVGDKGDLMELLGNLLDNAFKYCVRQVKLSAIAITVPDSRRRGVTIVVEDDGPGIALTERQHVLQRGARLDERASGQGIGLSVVQELASLYRGSVEIGESSFGGARITVQLLGL